MLAGACHRSRRSRRPALGRSGHCCGGAACVVAAMRRRCGGMVRFCGVSAAGRVLLSRPLAIPDAAGPGRPCGPCDTPYLPRPPQPIPPCALAQLTLTPLPSPATAAAAAAAGGGGGGGGGGEAAGSWRRGAGDSESRRGAAASPPPQGLRKRKRSVRQRQEARWAVCRCCLNVTCVQCEIGQSISPNDSAQSTMARGA